MDSLKKIFLCVMVAAMAAACCEFPPDFYVVNNSDENIYVLHNFDFTTSGTIMVDNGKTKFEKIVPGGKDEFGFDFPMYQTEWVVVFYRESYLDRHSWMEIMENNLIDTMVVVSRYDYKEEVLLFRDRGSRGR